MKTIKIIFVLCFAIGQNVFSQIKAKAIFELNVAEGEGTPSRKENYVIYFNGQRSIEFIQKANVQSIPQRENETVEIKTVELKGGKKFLYKDFKKKELIVHTGIMFKNYLIDDTLSNFKWKITKERKKILKYSCIKATTRFRGRNYEAWFTEDIPIQNGPWKFCGLPGLIVKICDDKQSFIYHLTEIDFKIRFDEKILELPKEYIKNGTISHEAFMGLYKKKLEENSKLSKVVQTSKNGNYSSVTIILPQIMEKY